MSFDRLSSLESQPTTMRRNQDPEYQDDPEFSRLTEQLSTKLFELTANISRLSNEISLLGTKRDTDRVRERVHDLLEDTRDGFKDIGDGVKKIQGWEDINPSQKYTIQKLSREFSASLSEFQVVQRRAMEKQRSASTAARTALDEQGGSAQSPDGQHRDQQQLQSQELNLASQDDVDFQDSLIVEREGEIRQIEQSVGELNELFRDVATMVGEQRDNLLQIDENVDTTLTATRGADTELRSASRYQKSARNKACCLLLILAIVLIIIVLAVVLG